MNIQQIKENMLGGEWTRHKHAHMLIVDKDNQGIASCSIRTSNVEDLAPMQNANLSAICLAVNNTFNQNINPEKVPILIKEIELFLTNMEGSGIFIDQRHYLKELINSAKL